jgi:hypothetical protein
VPDEHVMHNFILLLNLEMHPNGDVHRVIHDLWLHFHKEYDRHSLRNLTKKDYFC